MFGLATIAMFLAAPQEVPRPAPRQPGASDEICAVREAIGPDSEIRLSEGFAPGGMERVGKVALTSGGRPLQALFWSGHGPANPSGPPTKLSLRIPLRKTDPKGMVSIELDGRSFYLPVARTLGGADDKGYQVTIEQPDVLEALWASAHWRVSVLDSKGVALGAIEGALPGREAIMAAFARLAPDLDGRLEDAAKRCSANR